MKKSAERNAPSAEHGKLETRGFIGQIEQVVSSADCRSAKRSETQGSEFPSNKRDGAIGTRQSRKESAELEARLALALSRRGSRTIDEFLWRARNQMVMDLRPWRWVNDESLVEACERYATELGQ